MKFPYLILTLIISVFFISPVSAEKCDTEDIERLTTIANHVDLSYNIEKYENEEYNPYEYDMYFYNFNLSNLTEELYAINSGNNYSYQYNYSNNIDGQIKEYNLSGGRYNIDIYSTNCSKKLRTISITLPYYNQYSNTDKCQEEDYKDLTVCQEWTTSNIDYNTYEKNISIYEKEKTNNESDDINNITKFIQDNIIFISIGIITFIIILIIIISAIINKKRSELK